MKIGFDLDKVFIDYPPFIPSFIIDRLYKKKSNGVLLYRIPSKPEQLVRSLTHYSLFRPPIKKNLFFMQSLAQEKHHQYYLISSRFGFLKNKTESLVKKYKFDSLFKQLFFNYENKQPHLFKNEIIQQLKIDRYIDDDLALLLFLAKANNKTLFFWLNPIKNKQIKKNVFAVTHIADILKNI